MRKVDESIYLEKLRNLIEVDKVTQKEASKILGFHEETTRRWCKLHGIKTQRTGPRSGSGHPEWKGGRVLISRYWYIYSENHPYRTKANYVAEHRLVMERKLGRYLTPHEVVHHIDGDSQNNSPENLIVFRTNADHLKSELKGKIPNWTPEGKKRMGRHKNHDTIL